LISSATLSRSAYGTARGFIESVHFHEFINLVFNRKAWPDMMPIPPDNRDIKININIESVDYTMELDTDASLSLISEDSYQKYFSHLQLETSL
jgi:hypothetical protein